VEELVIRREVLVLRITPIGQRKDDDGPFDGRDDHDAIRRDFDRSVSQVEQRRSADRFGRRRPKGTVDVASRSAALHVNVDASGAAGFENGVALEKGRREGCACTPSNADDDGGEKSVRD